MTMLRIANVVIDMSVYPRAEINPAVVEHYAEALEAGDVFPPIILEEGTDRLLDGMHRYRAHRQLGRTDIAVERQEIPADIPPLLYAASLSARHGDRISSRDLQAVVRKVIAENPDFSMVTAAKCCGVSRQTVSKWASDITERRRLVRKVQATLLTRAGQSTRQIADVLGYSFQQVSNDVNDDISGQLTEDLLRAALDGLRPIVPAELFASCQSAAEAIREERIFADWSTAERDLLKRLRAGDTVVVNMRDTAHPKLVRWAEDAELFVRIDRRSDWGNPFEMPADGDRDTVVRNYAEHYLPHKPSLLVRLEELRGKALGCWCAPEPCHGDILISLSVAEGFVPGEPLQSQAELWGLTE